MFWLLDLSVGLVIASVSSVMKGLVFMPVLRGTVKTVDCFLGPYCMEIPRYSLQVYRKFYNQA